ncbi:phosphatidylglycerol lysyltransferase domain-containing protein [Haloferula sp. BvORR071]|uniref:bifunctional lysylphosphatidylglycerol flippase/synthetase MprF n=1 Tax=Haloferula sp. BvORR071 TaxID=1396141 RepID=UPI0005522E4D|nr:phosphatidylglycerol lysyltransferase domain-containing protein [Haloferula sp. BvORR071]
MFSFSWPVLRRLLILVLLLAGRTLADSPETRDVQLSRGPGVTYIFKGPEKPVAGIVFASGDGGWTDWENDMCGWLAEAGWRVAGLNCRTYAETDYDGDLLGNDFATLAKEMNLPPGTPIFYGGWSMGAGQAVAAAGMERPDNLKGLLLFSCGSRGRFGLRMKDELGIAPTGDGTFALSEFNDSLKDLRVAQFQGGADFISSTAWIKNLPAPSALYEMPGYDHGFDGPDLKFKPSVNQALGWLMGDDSMAPANTSKVLPWGLSPLWPMAALSILLVIVFLFMRRHAIRLLVAALVLIGLANLLEAMLPKPPEVIDWMQQWYPLGLSERVSEDSRLLLLLSGLSLLVLARGLGRRKRVAWWLATGLLAASALLHLVRAFDWHHAVAALVLMVPLIRWRREFIARSDAPSLRLGLAVAPLVAVVVILYGTISLHDLGESGKLPEPIDWARALGSSSTAVAGLADSMDDTSPEVGRLLDRLRLTGIAGGALVLFLLLRPVLLSRVSSAGEDERKRAAEILARHGIDPSDPYTLLPDKHYYFHESGEGYVAYACWRNIAVVLADPVCPPEMRQGLVEHFVRFCRKQDWTPIFYGTRQENRALYEYAGLVTFKVGEDARIPLSEFSLAGGKFQNLRTARNKAKKESLGFRWYDAAAGVDHGLEAQLTLLSDNWLRSKSGGEMTFDLGSFSLADIRENGCAVAFQADGQLECFATWRPYAAGKGRALDLMRGRGSPGGIMDFLILESLDHFRESGVEEISLGSAPLANTETDPANLSKEERQVKMLFDKFDRFYRYKSLFDFKRKYHPAWQGRYLAYPPGILLARIGLAVAAVHLPGGFRGLLRS